MFVYAWRALAAALATAAALTIWHGFGTVTEGDQPVEEDRFVVGGTLTEDGRIGKVTDVQGIVAVRPVMARRWTPVSGPVILKPGDWLRTDQRGANAVLLRLLKETRITLGPGTLVELTTPKQVKLHTGQLKIVAQEDSPVQLSGPDGQSVSVAGEAIYRVGQGSRDIESVDHPPQWLQGFEGATSQDTIGSLVVDVDGRNVPLTVGYHKVTVDIRDQIARTVIEESFVNRTNSRLEGVFYFPLPQDASISGFGMWIGQELVEADVVEKQRAREIYETILRERRDPGLLEWTGGNLFKARVFPIGAHSEKRIKISYTQVLPLKNGQYRYSYGLQSEMLKLHPLRELGIEVKLASLAPLADVRSPTHPCRIDRTARSAHLEFSAQEYTPDRDFEVVVQLEGDQKDITVIPHRRGEDGYFMLQLKPPGDDGQWRREILSDDEPLELLILADTSGSMDEQSRQKQSQFLRSILACLTKGDRFNLATCDATCDWVFADSQDATDDKAAKAVQFLDQRASLGWTDLDAAFASALAKCGRATHVIYVGDGVVTTGDADPVAFAKRLQRMCDGKGKSFHAVSTGSSFESIVLNAVAGIRGGSARHIAGEQTPTRVAAELLNELTRPALRDLKVRFEGLRVARVYPERLPNLPVGTQQILLGRYLPEDADQTGKVIVSGRWGDQPVQFSADISLKDTQSGNSFLPRLWARMHLNALLEQGASEAIKDEIIGLSEEYNIITTYTSLLVLESDEDRERFGVKRRFRMRDGEKFFAEGRDQADFALMQKQMRLAGNWRLGLRRDVLIDLVRMGRDAEVLQSLAQVFSAVWAGDLSMPVSSVSVSGALGPYGGYGGVAGGSGFARQSSSTRYSGGRKGNKAKDSLYVLDSEDGFAWYDGNGRLEDSQERFDRSDLGVEADAIEDLQATADVFADDFDFGEEMLSHASAPMPASEPQPARELYAHKKLRAASQAFGSFQPADGSSGYYGYLGDRRSNLGFGLDYAGRSGGWTGPPNSSWLTSLFPQVPPTPVVRHVESKWPQRAQRIADRLLRTEQLDGLQGGLAVSKHTESYEPRWKRKTGESNSSWLISPNEWLIADQSVGSQRLVQWCDEQERGIYSAALQLGRTRESGPDDLAKPPLGFNGWITTPLDQSYQNYTAKIVEDTPDQLLLTLQHPNSPGNELRLRIDTRRNVVLSTENTIDGTTTAKTQFSDFVQIAGAWWATRMESYDAESRRTGITEYEFHQLTRSEFARRITRQVSQRQEVQFIHGQRLVLGAAKQALADGKAAFEDHIVLALHAAQIQDWDGVFQHLTAAEELAAGRPGMRWVRYAALNASRRREALRKELTQEAASQSVVAAPNLFLADHIRGVASGVFEANEMLTLLDALQPIYTSQPAFLEGTKRWLQSRVSYLQQVGQSDEALELQLRLASEYAYDSNLHIQYARSLAQQGEHASAYEWLNNVMTEGADWLPYEEDSLRGSYADLQEEQGRFDELVTYLKSWVGREPTNQIAYSRLLSALVKSGREDEASKLTGKWLADGREHKELNQSEASRLNAAVSFCLGQGHNLYASRLDERWLEPLAATVESLATHDTQSSVAERIMQHWRFQRTDACRDVRRIMVRRLQKETPSLKAADIQRLVNWVWPDDPAVEVQIWRRVARELERRWTAEQDTDVKQQIGQTLTRILSGRLTAEERLTFLRRQLDEGPERFRANYASQRFDALIDQPWSSEIEGECFGLLDELSDAEVPTEKLRLQAAALYRLTDSMVRSRYEAEMETVEHPELLTRTELSRTEQDKRRLAREGLAAALKRQERQAESPLRPWFQMERLYLQTQLGANLDRVREECWEALGMPDPTAQAEPLQQILRTRYLATLSNLAVRRSASPDDAARLLKYLDRWIKETDEFDWKLMKYQLLLALDRPEDLEKSLRAWIRPEDADNFWRRALAYLAAEQGRIDESISLFERIRSVDELWPEDYRALAGWYMVVNAQDKHERSLIEAFKATDEYQLSNWLRQQLQPWQRQDLPMPSELDKDVLRVFAALLEKASQPQNYQWQLREFYQATHDFRLLACLGDAVVGHTAGRIYPFLEQMRPLFDEIRDEATADSIIEHLDEVRKRAETPVDNRALNLLEVFVERRSSEILNQPGPHVHRALTALQKSFKGDWTDGEARLMADLLAGLGKISQQPLAEEQVRQLESLHASSANGSIDRLHIAHAVARAYWSYDRREQAIDLLESELNIFQTACDGLLPMEANAPLDTLIEYLESEGHFVQGEDILSDQLDHPANRQQNYWLTQRLFQLYDAALGHDGETSLGRGQEMYGAVLKRIVDELETSDQNHRYQIVSRLCSIFKTCKRKGLDGVADDLRDFSFGRLSRVLGIQTNNYQSIVNQVANTLRDVAGTRDGLELLIFSIEGEPRWFRLNNQDGWNQHGYLLAQWRSEVGDQLGDLAPRLLAIVVAELKRDLESQQQRSRSIYHDNYSYFWAEKAKEYRQAAEEVYQQHRHSGSTVAFIAEYLYHGLDAKSRAIEILQIAHDEKRLDESGQVRLVDYLQREGRFAATIPILEPLVEVRPENIQYRKWLMNSYFNTKQQDKLLNLLAATDKHFHQEGRWQENIMAALAESCLENTLYTRSVEYFKEAIDVHERTQPNRGIGQGTLPSYFCSLARAYQGLGQTPEAVEAASGAIVAWGPRHDDRAYALQVLEQVIRSSPDMDAFARHMDEQAEKTGLHNPIVRKALGKAYMDQHQWAKALPHLRLACELQPNDTETHQQLVECLDQLGDKQGVIDQLLVSLRVSRRALSLYGDLARCYEAQGQLANAERARTSLVEALPNESEGHAMLAEIRQSQGRWKDAAAHWQQVARIRSLEPTGLLNMAKAQIQLEQWKVANETVERLQARNWPPRFANEMEQVRELERQIAKALEAARE